MARIYEGKIIINLNEFFRWVNKEYLEGINDNITYGVPNINKTEKTMEIDFAASSEGPIEDWSLKPKALKQWE